MPECVQLILGPSISKQSGELRGPCCMCRSWERLLFLVEQAHWYYEVRLLFCSARGCLKVPLLLWLSVL